VYIPALMRFKPRPSNHHIRQISVYQQLDQLRYVRNSFRGWLQTAVKRRISYIPPLLLNCVGVPVSQLVTSTQIHLAFSL
jgi:hypothetical protein